MDHGGSGDGRACSGSALPGHLSRRNPAESAPLTCGHTGYTGGIAPIVHIVLHRRRTLSPAAKRHGTDQYVLQPGSGKQGLAGSGRIPDRQCSVWAPFDADRVPSRMVEGDSRSVPHSHRTHSGAPKWHCPDHIMGRYGSSKQGV